MLVCSGVETVRCNRVLGMMTVPRSLDLTRHFAGAKLIGGLSCIALALAGCGTPYRSLAEEFPSRSDFPARAASSELFSITVRHNPRVESLALDVGMDDSAIHLRPAAGSRYTTVSAEIPLHAIAACSKTCFPGRQEVNLLLREPGIQLGITEAPEVLEWCWQAGLPLISAAVRTEWLYGDAELPNVDDYGQVDREEFYRQADQIC